MRARGGAVAAVVSSLPLLIRPEGDRFELLDQAFEMMAQEGLFVQFTYGLTESPMPTARQSAHRRLYGKGSRPILLNIPPARVWRYREAGHAGAPGERKARKPRTG